MRLEFQEQFSLNARDLIRRCGYGEISSRPHTRAGQTVVTAGKLPSVRDRLMSRGSEVSYVRRLGSGEFPRFHVYIDSLANGFVVNLHLDQKPASYEGSHAHSGEYDGPLVEAEETRIQLTCQKYLA